MHKNLQRRYRSRDIGSSCTTRASSCVVMVNAGAFRACCCSRPGPSSSKTPLSPMQNRGRPSRGTMMARPRKSEADLRSRWDALYVTGAERLDIEASARAAGLSPGRYLYARHLGQAPIRAHNKSLAVAALAEASRKLDAVVREIATAASEIDAVRIAAQLLSIERSFRRAVFAPSNAIRFRENEEGPEE